MSPHSAVVLAASDTGKGSPIGLFVVLLLIVAVYLLYRSMSGHLRRLPDRFPGYGAAGTDGAGADGVTSAAAATTSTGSTGAGSTGADGADSTSADGIAGVGGEPDGLGNPGDKPR